MITHGLCGTRIHNVWRAMIARCGKSTHPGYAWYGGRGISVCERWLNLDNFYADMGDPPPGLSLDRIDNDGPYHPDNCKWSTQSEQGRNRRSNRMLKYRGEIHCVTEWAELLGTNASTLRVRLTRKWSTERALGTPVRGDGKSGGPP